MNFLRHLSRRRHQQAVLSEELQSHLEEAAEELIASGYSPEEARLEARRQFGNRTRLLEESRAVWRVKWLDALLRDLRFTGRLARRQPWTMAAAIASIAIGVGANTAVTTVVDTVLLNPLGIRNSTQLVAATVHLTKLQMAGAETSGAEFRDLQSMPGVFSSVTATEGRAWTFGADHPARLLGLAVTSGFWQVFDQKPALGQFPDGSNPNQVVLSDAVWTSEFGRDQSVLGRKIMLDAKPYQVVAVASPSFHFPASAQAWIPLILAPDRFERGNNMTLSLYADLKAGVSQAQAQQAVNHLVSNLEKSPGGSELRNLAYGIDIQSLAKRVAGDLRLPLLLLWSAAFVLLLAACANVAGLLLARAGSRRKEMAIRISVGAGRLQIFRQLLTESLILALLGGAAGLLVAFICLQALKLQPLPYQNILLLVHLNYRVLAYGMTLAVASSLLFGVVPAVELLKDQHVSGLARSRRKWFQNVYIVGQVSAAMLLLVVTGLLLKSLKAVESLHPGFNPRDLTTAFLIKPAANQTAFFDRLLSELRATPGVQSAALAYSLPFGGDTPTSLFDIKGHHRQPHQPEWHGEAYQITSDYFATMQIPLLRGRPITESDTAAAPHVCVIDATLAQRFFPDQDPIGQELAMYDSWARIVGVVGTVRDTTLEQVSRPAVYYSLAQSPHFQQLSIVVRSQTPSPSIIRNSVRQANPSVPVFDLKTMEDRIDTSISTRSVIALLVTVFAAISMLLAAIGIHGVLAQVVTEHTSEIGIRMALGARSSGIFQRYATQGLQLSLTGIVIGVAAAIACRGWLRSFVYQVQPIDPSTLILGILGVLLVSIVAVLAPSWRASHIDPQTALRTE